MFTELHNVITIQSLFVFMKFFGMGRFSNFIKVPMRNEINTHCITMACITYFRHQLDTKSCYHIFRIIRRKL